MKGKWLWAVSLLLLSFALSMVGRRILHLSFTTSTRMLGSKTLAMRSVQLQPIDRARRHRIGGAIDYGAFYEIHPLPFDSLFGVCHALAPNGSTEACYYEYATASSVAWLYKITTRDEIELLREVYGPDELQLSIGNQIWFGPSARMWRRHGEWL